MDNSGDDDTGIPESFAKRIREALEPDLKGVGDGLSELDALHACAKVLLERATQRRIAKVKAVATVAIAKASAK